MGNNERWLICTGHLLCLYTLVPFPVAWLCPYNLCERVHMMLFSSYGQGGSLLRIQKNVKKIEI